MNKKLTLYSTIGCGNCMKLKKILDAKKIEYEVEENMDRINAKAISEGLSELPILVVIDDEETVYSGSKAVIYGKEL